MIDGDDARESLDASVLCVGHVNWDVTLRVDRLPSPDGEVTIEDRVQKGGGSAANVASGLAGLGASASLFGSVGDDDSGRLALAELRAADVDADPVRVVDGDTAVKYLVVDGDGEVMVLANEGANEAFAVDDLPADALADIAYCHLTSQSPATAAALAERASDAGVPVSFDPGRRLDRRDYGATFDHVDVLFVNRREATALVDGDGFQRLPDDAVVVIKRGADGAEVRTLDDSVDHPGFDVSPLDTTGAGDAFAAGFLASLLRTPGNHERALAVANACGAIGAGTVGARTDISWDRVESFLAEHEASV